MGKYKSLIKLILGLFLTCTLISVKTNGQSSDFTGYRIFINPGHGGYDPDDRHMLPADFWESEGNLIKGLCLRQLMTNLKATVFMSRTTNTSADDLPLSTISAMANSANADFFLSIHSNGYNGTQNQPLMLYRGYDNQPVFAEAKTIAGILWQKVFERGNCWTSSSAWVKGDWTFYPEWGTMGLGVLRGLTMPGVLSEGSFHDYVPESWRLRNNDFLHHEAWAFVRGLTEYENVTPVTFGIITGIVRDTLKSPSWYFKPGTRDATMPLNNVEVRLIPGNRTYKTDNFNNGFFMFDSVAPGQYKLFFDGPDDYINDSLAVSVLANKTAFGDIWLDFDTSTAPVVTGLNPITADSVVFNQEFTISFSIPMDKDSVQMAISSIPSIQFLYTWNEPGTILKIRPAIQYEPKTNYLVTLSTKACSKWMVNISESFVFNFLTKNRTRLFLEKSFPRPGNTEISIYPQIRLIFDAPLSQPSVSSHIKFTDDQGLPVPRRNEVLSESGGKGIYCFEPYSALSLDKTFKIILDKELSDIGGNVLIQDKEISFTTRTEPYNNGSVIESFDDISVFWDPETSGSTVGTDNPLTTFSSSTLILRGGSAAGKLDYVFVNGDGGVCRTYDTRKPVVQNDFSKEFGMWVFGDLSFNILEYWFYSSGNVNQIVRVDTIDWAGWEFKSIPVSSIGGSGDHNYHSIVIIQTHGGAKSGTIYFDQAQLVSPTGIPEHPEDTPDDIMVYPNPFSGTSKLSFRLKESSEIKLEVLSLSGSRVEHLADGRLEPGNYSFDWTPSSSVADGIYFYRLEIRRPGTTKPKLFYTKCVLIR
jgi:N-acetylmuramoyl-L-alanine amidase